LSNIARLLGKWLCRRLKKSHGRSSWPNVEHRWEKRGLTYARIVGLSPSRGTRPLRDSDATEIGWAFLGLRRADQEVLLGYFLGDHAELAAREDDPRFRQQLRQAFRNLEKEATKRGIE
jgi:hypothetical protein